jgi:hypothetical protein
MAIVRHCSARARSSQLPDDRNARAAGPGEVAWSTNRLAADRPIAGAIGVPASGPSADFVPYAVASTLEEASREAGVAQFVAPAIAGRAMAAAIAAQRLRRRCRRCASTARPRPARVIRAWNPREDTMAWKSGALSVIGTASR